MITFLTHFFAAMFGAGIGVVTICLLQSAHDFDEINAPHTDHHDDPPMNVISFDRKWSVINQPFEETEIAE
jgi:hypothetical protein